MRRFGYVAILVFTLMISSGGIWIWEVYGNITLPSESSFKIAYLDVGHGDSAVIFNGNKTMVIDTGRLDRTIHLVGYLKQNGIHHIDYLIVTHPHFDHDGGAPVIERLFHVTTVYEYENLYTYDRLPLGNDINITVLSPEKGLTYSDINSRSIVLLIEKNGIKFLFTADIQRETEYAMLSDRIDVDADIIKVPHHGSSYASSMEFVSHVTPQVAIISAGESFTEPNQDVIHTYETVMNRGSYGNYPLFITRDDGDVIIESCEEGVYTVTTTRTHKSEVFRVG